MIDKKDLVGIKRIEVNACLYSDDESGFGLILEINGKKVESFTIEEAYIGLAMMPGVIDTIIGNFMLNALAADIRERVNANRRGS